MATTNEDFRDALTRHQVGLQRLTGSVRNQVIDLLNATEADLRDQIVRALSGLKPGVGVQFTPTTVRRLQALEKSIGTLRRSATDAVFDVWNAEMRALAVAEPAFVATAMTAVAPVVLDLALPSAGLLEALVSQQPFEGKTLRQWASSVRRADLDRIMGAVRVGMVQGASAQQIARSVVGSARLRGRNGVTQITRRNAAAITRTAVTHFSNKAKEQFYLANRDVISEEVYIATLDARTTPICRSLDGERFPVGEGPRPPLHFACRSTRVGVIDGEVLGRRPLKPVTERMLLREFAGPRGIPVPRNRAGLPRGTKGAFDRFARARTRELVGTAPAVQTYQQFLSNQSAEFQNDVLGVTKARLFRRGGLTLDRYVDRAGNELTLGDLARTEADAFRQAGLDPGNFL